MTPRHRLVIRPWFRKPGRFLLPDWLAITIGDTIFAWRELTDGELSHELEHVRQWRRMGIRFPIVYVAASVRAVMAGERWYTDNRFEVEARAAAERSSDR